LAGPRILRMDKPSNSKETLLKSNGLKVTLPRLKVLEIFEKSEKRHLTADDVFKHLTGADSDVGLATVYRILMQFVEAGMLARSTFDSDKAFFELNQGDHHDHLICVRCGKVEEFFDDAIEKRQQEIAVQHGFQLIDHAMTLYGVCADAKCRDAS
jgi:Fur family transcriptional regulator, ferric uptake regulator